MCTCASCNYTHADKFHAPLSGKAGYVPGSNFALWPKEEPAGPRSSAAAYASHWSYCGAAFHAKRAVMKLGGPAVFPSWMTGNGPIPQAPAWVRRAINPGVDLDARSAPAANVVAVRSPKVRAPQPIAPASNGPSIADLLELAIATRGERAQGKHERMAA